MEKPFVTIAMPALNEERYIGRALLSLRRIPDEIEYEILVLDGGSTDYTRPIVEMFSQADPRIRLVPNERRIQAAAINRAASVADPRSRYILRADCHADYPPGFVQSCLDALEQSGAASVVVRMETVGATCFQKAVATAQNSRLGNGGSAHRTAGASRFVDHGHHALIRRDVFLALGGYDESFSHNEDAEFDLRLREAGWPIWLNAAAAVGYYPRSTIASLARQYFLHGRGRAKTVAKHRMMPKPRQLLPPLVVGIGLLALLASPVEPYLLLVPLAYVAAALLAGAVLAVRNASACSVGSGLAALVMHTSWAVGFTSTLLLGSPSSPAGQNRTKPVEAHQPRGPSSGLESELLP